LKPRWSFIRRINDWVFDDSLGLITNRVLYWTCLFLTPVAVFRVRATFTYNNCTRRMVTKIRRNFLVLLVLGLLFYLSFGYHVQSPSVTTE
jgi:hypothetical protein